MMSTILLSDCIEAYRETSQRSWKISKAFRQAFLKIAKEHYQGKFETLSVDFPEQEKVLFYIIRYILPKNTKSLENSIRNYFSNLTDSGNAIPERRTIYQLILLLDWNMDDINALFTSLSMQESNYCGSLYDNVYHYSLVYKKGLSWAEDMLEKLHSETMQQQTGKASFEKHYLTAEDQSIYIRETIRKAIEIEDPYATETIAEIRDKHFESKMKELLADFNHTSGTLTRIFRAMRANGPKGMALFFANLYNPPTNDENGNLLFESDYIGKLLSDIAPKKQKKTADVASLPTREFLILYSAVHYWVSPDIRDSNDSLEGYINQNLVDACLFPLDENKKIDSLLLELSHYQLEEETKTLSYKGQTVILPKDFEKHIPLSKKLKKENQTLNYIDFILQEYDRTLAIKSIFRNIPLKRADNRSKYRKPEETEE